MAERLTVYSVPRNPADFCSNLPGLTEDVVFFDRNVAEDFAQGTRASVRDHAAVRLLDGSIHRIECEPLSVVYDADDDIRRRALGKLSPAERRVLGLPADERAEP